MSCHVMSCHVLSCHVMSCHVMSRHVMSCDVMSCHVMSCHVMSCHVMSCHVLSCHVMSCHVMSSHLMSSHVISCHVMSCHVMSCHVMSCHVLSYHAMSCHEPSKFFYYGGGVAPTRFRNRGPVRESGSERRSRCGAVRAASVRVWRRAHFFDLGVVLRGRLRESCVLGACPGRAGWHVAALCRGDWVPGAFCIRMVTVRLAWQAAGIVRAGSVLGACPRAVSAALCRGEWVPGVSRARDFTRCNLRFAWQAWDFGCIDVLGKARDVGSAWQAL